MKPVRFLFNLMVVLVLLYFGAQILIDRALESSIGAKVRIGSLRVNVNPTELEIRRIKISNLRGFKEPYLAVIPEILVQISLADLLKGQPGITLLRVNLEDVRIEKNSMNQVNLNELRKNLKKIQLAADRPSSSGFSSVGTTSPSAVSARPPGAGDAKSSRGLKIDRAVFTLGKVIYADSSKNPIYRKEFVMNIREQELQNAHDPTAVTEQLILAILSRAGLNLAGAQLDQWSAQMGAQAGELIQTARKNIEQFFG